MNDCYQPILLKKSAVSSTTEKYALEIKIFTLSSGFRVHISCSTAKKRHFQRLVFGQSGRTDFFNRIGQKLPCSKAKKPKSQKAKKPKNQKSSHNRKPLTAIFQSDDYRAVFSRYWSNRPEIVVVSPAGTPLRSRRRYGGLRESLA